MAERGCAAPVRPISTFTCDPYLNVSRTEGELLGRLGYDSSELIGKGWEKVVTRESWPTAARISLDLGAGQTGEYGVVNVGKDGHRLYLKIRTFFVHSGPQRIIRGISILEAWESPRTIIVLKGVIKCWWLPYVYEIGKVFA